MNEWRKRELRVINCRLSGNLSPSLSDEPVHMYKAFPNTGGGCLFGTVGKSSSPSRGSNCMIAKNGLDKDRRPRLNPFRNTLVVDFPLSTNGG